MAAARRRRYGADLAREIAAGLSGALESLRAGAALRALEAEVDIPAALVARSPRRSRASGVWAIRVSAVNGDDPQVTVNRHEAAGAA